MDSATRIRQDQDSASSSSRTSFQKIGRPLFRFKLKGIRRFASLSVTLMDHPLKSGDVLTEEDLGLISNDKLVGLTLPFCQWPS